MTESQPKGAHDGSDVDETVRVLRQGQLSDALLRGLLAVLGYLVEAKPYR
jgi:hypothetical protein